MTSAAGAHKTLGTRAVEAAILGAITVLAWLVARATHGTVGSLAAVGLLLLGGTLASELVEGIGVPHLTGYLVAGAVFGPHLLGVVDHATVVALSPVSGLALALIALEGGAHLKLEVLKRVLASLAWATLLQTSLVMVGLMAIFLAARGLLPWAHALGSTAAFGVAILWGVLGVTRSPSAVLGILSQTRANGPVATATLTFVMVSDVVVVVAVAVALTLARPLLEPGGLVSMRELEQLFREVLGSVALGTTLGLVLAAYLRLVGSQLVVVLLALGFGFTEMTRYLHFDALLAFMIAGFVVQNLTAQGPKLLASIEGMGSVVYVVFFGTAGAHLDLPLVAAMWKVALLLSVARVLLTMAAGRLASRLAKDEPTVTRYGWCGLVSQAGLALGVAVVVEHAFPTFGPSFRTLAVASIAMNEMAGPILFKLALDRAGETAGKRAPDRPSVVHEVPK